MSTFKEQIEKGLGCAVILAGSGSDESHIKKIADSLRKYGVPFEVRIVSAHKQLTKLLQILDEYNSMNGPLAYIAIAGGTDTLSGILSYNSHKPTISCPPDLISNHTCLTNPPGSSNSTIYHPSNVGRFIAQMFSHCNERYFKAITEESVKKRESLEKDDATLRRKFGE